MLLHVLPLPPLPLLLPGTPQEDHAATVIQRNFRKHKRGSGNLHGLTGKAAAAEALHPHSRTYSAIHTILLTLDDDDDAVVHVPRCAKLTRN